MKLVAVLLPLAAARGVEYVYRLKHSVCCFHTNSREIDRNWSSSSSPHGHELISDWRRLLDQVVPEAPEKGECSYRMRLKQQLLESDIRQRRGSMASCSSVASSISSGSGGSNASVLPERTLFSYISKKAKLLYPSNCAALEVEIPLGYRLNREFDLDYITAYDFDQLSTPLEVAVTIWSGLVIKEPHMGNKVREEQSSRYVLTREMAESVPHQLFEDDNNVDAWVYRDNDKSKFRRLMQYLTVTSITGREVRGYERAMSEAVFNRMKKLGAFASVCGAVLGWNEKPPPTAPPSTLSHYFPLTGLSTIGTLTNGEVLANGVGHEECFILKIENNRPSPERPRKVFLIKFVYEDGDIRATVVDSKGFTNVSDRDMQAVLTSIMPALVDMPTPVLSVCSKHPPPALPADRPATIRELFTPGRKVKAAYARFGKLVPVETKKELLYCTHLLVYGVLHGEYSSAPFRAGKLHPHGFSVVIIRTFKDKFESAMPFWNVFPDELFNLLGVYADLSLEDAFAQYAKTISSRSSRHSTQIHFNLPKNRNSALRRSSSLSPARMSSSRRSVSGSIFG